MYMQSHRMNIYAIVFIPTLHNKVKIRFAKIPYHAQEKKNYGFLLAHDWFVGVITVSYF